MFTMDNIQVNAEVIRLQDEVVRVRRHTLQDCYRRQSVHLLKEATCKPLRIGIALHIDIIRDTGSKPAVAFMVGKS